jgi:tetratricopeptide (TPR) repeat protein
MPRIKCLIVVCLAVLLAGPASAQGALWQALFDGGVKAQSRDSLSEAEKQFAAALKNADDDTKIAQTAGKLAFVYDLEGKFPEAQEQYMRVLEVDKKLHGQTSTAVGVDLNSLGLVCQHGGKFTDAETFFKQSADVFEQAGKKVELAGALTNLALLMQETAKYDAVEPLFKRALALYEKSGDQLALAGILDRYAAFCQLESRYSEADALYSRALSLRQSQAGESSALVADTLCALGQLHTAQGDYTKGENELRHALSIAKLTGQNKTQEAEVSTALADCLRQQGRNLDARILYQNALDLLQTTTGMSNTKVAEALRNLAQNYVDTGDYVRAESLLLKALGVDEQSYGALHPDLAVDLQTLGLVLLDQGKYDQAEQLYTRALKLTETVLGPSHPSTATSLNNLAWLYYNMGKYDQAEPLVVRALTIRQKQFGAKHPLVAQNLSIFAVILSAQRKYDEAEPLLLRAIAAEEGALGVDHPDISENLKNLAVIYNSAGRTSEAEETLRKLLRRDEKAFGQSSAAVASDLEALSAVLGNERNIPESLQLLTRAQKIKAALPGAISSSAVQQPILPTTSPPSSSAASRGKIDRPVKDKWALVVGISNFKDPAINLKYAAKDATDFRNYLVNDAHFAPDHVRLLVDNQATRENIISTLGEKWLRRLANSDDLVCIYISSHGSEARADAHPTNYVVPYEGNIDNILLTGIPMQDLTAGIKDLVHCDRMIVVLDVCHGGAAVGDSKGVERQADVDNEFIAVGEGQVVIASSRANQISWESKNYQNAVFTRRLIEGLKKKGDKTTIDEAFDYMKDQVEQEVLRDRAQLQTPLMEKRWQGEDVFLGLMPSSPRPGLKEPPPAGKAAAARKPAGPGASTRLKP